MEQLETGYDLNIVTTASSGNETCLTRVFAPALGNPEDQVCGSSNCVLAPYWANKLGLGQAEMRVKQVSARGGNLRVRCEDTSIKLKGQVRAVGQGVMYI